MVTAGRPARTVVVTGGAGFIGTHTVEALLEGGHTVVVLDDLRHASTRPLDPRADLLELDLSAPAARERIIAARPDGILHLAAQGGVNRSWRDPFADAETNVMGTVNVLMAAQQVGCRVVMASSGGALYGSTDTLPTPETHAARPRSPYGAAKLAAEGYLHLFAYVRGLSTLALRYGNVYGPGQDGTGEAGVVAITCDRLLGGLPPIVRGDGTQTRDFVYVGDIADANVRALAATATGAVNVGTGTETSVGDVVRGLAAIAGYEGDPQAEPLPDGEVRRSRLDPTRAAEELDWHAVTDLGDGLGRTYADFSLQAGVRSQTNGSPRGGGFDIDAPAASGGS